MIRINEFCHVNVQLFLLKVNEGNYSDISSLFCFDILKALPNKFYLNDCVDSKFGSTKNSSNDLEEDALLFSRVFARCPETTTTPDHCIQSWIFHLTMRRLGGWRDPHYTSRRPQSTFHRGKRQFSWPGSVAPND